MNSGPKILRSCLLHWRQLHEYKVYLLVLVSKASLIWSPALPFKNLSSLSWLCMKLSNLTILFEEHTFAWKKSLKIAFVQLWGLKRENWLRRFRWFSVRTWAEWPGTNRTLVGHQPLIYSKMCFTKTEWACLFVCSNNKNRWYNILVTLCSNSLKPITD